jgi:hypothetical protein
LHRFSAYTEVPHISKLPDQVVRHPLLRSSQVGRHRGLAEGHLGPDRVCRAFRFAKSRNKTNVSITADVDGPLIKATLLPVHPYLVSRRLVPTLSLLVSLSGRRATLIDRGRLPGKSGTLGTDSPRSTALAAPLHAASNAIHDRFPMPALFLQTLGLSYS